MKKILFLIHDLGQGGAEKVLVNLVNNLDRSKFHISVIALFGGGVNEQFLAPDIHYRAVFPRSIPGNSKLMKLLSPRQLHRLCVKEHYDIEVSYLEGPSARIISGCPSQDTKLVSWIHCTMHSPKDISQSFRSFSEAKHKRMPWHTPSASFLLYLRSTRLRVPPERKERMFSAISPSRRTRVS